MAYQKFNNGRAKTILLAEVGDVFIAPPGVTNTAGAASATSATVGLSGGVITTVVLAAGQLGSGYATPPALGISSSGGGTGAVLTAVLAADGSIASVTVVNGGSGYIAGTWTTTVTGGTFNYAQPCEICLCASTAVPFADGSITVTTPGGDSVSFTGLVTGTVLPVQVVKVTAMTKYTHVVALW